MVLESVVVEVLNRFLSDYVENLDCKQLKIGIWGGDVVLKNLILKQSALNDLNLPIQTVYGRLSSLILKIPWKNLYTAAVEAEIDGLYLLVEPNSQIKYDAAKEERQELEAKKAELEKVENIKKKNKEADKPPIDDTFVEKLTTQIVKNVQIEIKNIHIRYEDKVTNPGHSFATGISLSSLSMQTTNENWIPNLATDAMTQIYKIMEMEGLSIYWNCDAFQYADIHKEDRLTLFQKEIATKQALPKHFQYILGPINSMAKLILNPKPHLDKPAFSVAKLQAELTMDKLAIGISKCQYRDLILFANSMEMLNRGHPFRKYRPNVDGYKTQSKEWWQFAYVCVLESEVRRVRRNWEWRHIINHRQLCRDYTQAYRTKLTSKKLSLEAKETLEGLERRLDVFNIVLLRQQIELEVERLGILEKEVAKAKAEKSWFGGWWGGNATETEKDLKNATDIVRQFQNAMTPEEKAHLFKAIDYSQNAGPTIYPDEFVDTVFIFNLHVLEMVIYDDEEGNTNVVTAQLLGVKCKVQKREAMKALTFNVNISNLNVRGLENDELQPLMVTSSTPADEQGSDLLSVLFEINPLDRICDQRLHLNSKPLKIIYDAITINKVVDVFQPPKSSDMVALEQLTAATASGLSNIREMSASGLENIINQQPRLDLQVELYAPYVLLPYGGRYTDVENVLVVNFGKLQITSLPRRADISLRDLVKRGRDNALVFQELVDNSYDRFEVSFTGLQILLAQGGEDWMMILLSGEPSFSHLLHPMEVHVQFSKCLVMDDPRLPRMKLTGKLPSLSLYMSDIKLLTLLALVNSIPFPNNDNTVPPPGQLSITSLGSMTVLKHLQFEKTTKIIKQIQKPVQMVQFTELELNFVMEEMVLRLSRQDTAQDTPKDTLSFSIHTLECDFKQQTYNKLVHLRLGNITLDQHCNDEIIRVIDSPIKDGEYLIEVNFIQVDKKSPEFQSLYGNCECKLGLVFSSLSVLLNQVALTDLLVIVNNMQMQIEEVNNVKISKKQESEASLYKRQPSVISNLSNFLPTLTELKKKPKKLNRKLILFRLTADLQQFSVTIENPDFKIATISVAGIFADVLQKHHKMVVNAKLLDLHIENLNPDTVYKTIICGMDEEAINAKILLYYGDDNTDIGKVNMSVEATVGNLRIVVLNRFISNIMNFLENFQAAQAAIQAVATDAAETAKQNMQQAYQNATRIALKINLKAPTFYVPEATNSLNALLIDTGFIRITNVFKELEIKNENNVSAIMDDLTLDLTDFKIMRILLDSTSMNIVQYVNILEPLSFQFICRRNLSTGWYTAPPDIDVSAKINNIVLHLSQPDFNMVINMVQYNFGDTVPNKIVTASKLYNRQRNIALLKVTSAFSYTSGHQFVRRKSGYKHNFESKNVEDHIHCFFKWSFRMDNFIINLFSVKISDDKHEFNDIRTDLSRFSLSGLSLTGRMLTDNTLTASVLLTNCLIDDTRPSNDERHLNRLFERKPDETAKMPYDTNVPTTQMVQINVQKSSNDVTVDLKVYSITTILSMDFISKLAEFFKLTEQNMDLEKFKVSPPAGIKTIKVESIEAVIERESIITINVMLEKPDIILVENMNNIDTYALVLNTEMLVKLRLSGKHQVINGTISDTTLFICCFNPEKREHTKAPVLHPVTISASGSTPTDKGLHIDVVFSNVKISVSPTTIEIANRIMAAFTSTAIEMEKSLVDLLNLSKMWDMTPYLDRDYWFLREEHFEVGQDIVVELERPPEKHSALTELCMLSLPSFVATVEAGIGTKTIPMILLQSSLIAKVSNWSSQLAIDAELTLQMGYYNSYLAVWEPLIEPIYVKNGISSSYIPWSMNFELLMAPTTVNTSYTSLSNLTQGTIPNATSDGDSSEQISPAAVSIDLSSRHSLELTVTKTALEVLGNLSKAFSNAMTIAEEPKVRTMEAQAPYRMINNTGIEINILLHEGDFDLYENPGHHEAVLENLAEVNLQEKVKKSNRDVNLKRILHTTRDNSENYIHVQIKKLNSELKLPIIRADVRYFPIKYKGESNDNWGLISSVVVEDGMTTISLSSIILVHNHFNVPIDIYYMTARGNELAMVATIQPNGKLHLPLAAVYTPTNEIFLSVNGYSVTTTPFVWKDLQLNLAATKMLNCAPENKNSEEFPFMIKVVGEVKQVYHENTLKHTMLSTMYHIHLRPGLVLKNCLPVDVILCLQDLDKQQTVEPGASTQVSNVEPGKSYIIIRIPNYLEKEWSCRRDIVINPSQFTVWTFDSHDSVVKMSLDLGMQNFNKGGTSVMSLYCPFWMLNKTGLLLSYRKSKKTEKNEAAGTTSKADENLNIIHHPRAFNSPILFSFNAKNFFGKKKAAIRIAQGDWSDKFSLDVAGSSGVVTCKSNNIIYQIGVSNKLTYNGLTKQVTFTPYYVLINNAHFSIEVQELSRPIDAWTAVGSRSCTPLWTCSENDDKLLIAKIVGTNEVTAPFLITESHTTLLKLKNKYGGINVDIQLTEGAAYINMTSYEKGMAPVLIINNTQHIMNFWEKESVQLRKLDKMHSLLYTWENPSGPRVIMWEGGFNTELENDVRKDDVGDYMITETQKVYWVSFLDGMQRILLFTVNEIVAENAQSAKKFEIVEQEITLNLYGVGISLINNIVRKEIMYMAIASTGIIWETCKLNSKRYKPLTEKDNIQMEGAYQQFMNKYALSTIEIANYMVDNKIEVDFIENLILKPHKRYIRRTFQNGLWIQLKTSPHQMQMHAKVNRVQIDNQLYDCIFPVVLAPVPLPKSVGESGAHKPFIELSIVELLMKHSQIKQYKYFKVLIQEFHIKVDLGFVNAIIEVFNTAESTDEEDKESFKADIVFAEDQLYNHVSTQYMQEQKNFYDLLHFSPLKIHISFSLVAGSSGTSANVSTPNIINVLLQGLGVTLTDLQDVIFKLGYFEREYSFLSQKQLTNETQSHYVGQLVKQLYVLVFGLDVIGNPYGLVIGISKGVEDLFYEPFQGAIQGPGEFAEGLVLGVRSLFGHTVGGAAGAVSRITGAMGKGIAALTFDKDYQRKRRDQINKKPETVQEGIARSGKGLVMGVVDGVTGVFTKPISGAKEEGIEGFLKGVGKGALGLLTRPTAGVVDFASSSFDTVKRVTEVGHEEITRMRPPRFIPPDGLIRPFNFKESEGHKLLNEVEKGKYSTTDVYAYHIVIFERKEALLLTDKRIAYITYSDLFGGWQMAWSYIWSDLKTPPKIVPKGVLISTEGSKKKKMALFGSADMGKTLLISDQQLCAEVCAKIEELQKKS